MSTATRRTALIGSAWLLFLVTAAGRAVAQAVEWTPITLEQAIEEALAGNANLQVDEARAEAARAASRGTGATLLPRVDLVSGWMRSNDPVAVFGTRLRQGSFAQADFEIEALNRPDALTDWTTALSATWTLLTPSGWADTRAAGARARAADLAYRRSREAVHLTTEALYLDVLRTEAALEAATRAETAATANADLFAKREAQGLLTRAEALQAESERAAAAAARIEADRQRSDAAERLAVYLGWFPDRIPQPVDDLLTPGEPATRPIAGSGAVIEDRLDLRARRADLEASRASHRRATAAWLPSVVASGTYGVHDADPFGSSGEDWTLAVALRWTVFAGGGRVSEARRTRAELEAAEALYEHAVNQAIAEVNGARRAVDASARSVEAAAAARAAAEAGTGLMRRRFEEGLATASDLLSAESRLARAEQREIDARAAARLAEARLRFVSTHELPENRQ